MLSQKQLYIQMVEFVHIMQVVLFSLSDFLIDDVADRKSFTKIVLH